MSQHAAGEGRGAGGEQGLRVEVHRGADVLDRLAPAWNALAHRGVHPHTADAVYMRAFWTGFVPNRHRHSFERGFGFDHGFLFRSW